MAELSDRKQQNQAFLQELERQRLNKDCLRIIDLRGKVTGECQAYQFGGRRHYLDDRGYLLVKQLMAHAGGRYTVGVYEALFKALKQLDDVSPDDVHESSVAPVLSLDTPLKRAEDRIQYSTPILLHLDDVLYHGHTVDMAINALRISFKRTYSLHQGDEVRIEFADFFQQHGEAFLQNVPYRIIKLEHDANYTTVVLSRSEQADPAFSRWLEQWLATHTTQRQVDIDNELINLQTVFYQRLWLSRLSHPVLWLGAAEMTQPLLNIHMLPAANDLLQRWQGNFAQWLQQLPLVQLAKSPVDWLLVFDQEHSYSVPLSQTTASKKLLNWHLSRPGSQLYLLKPAPLSLDENKRRQTLSMVASVNNSYAQELERRLQQIRMQVSVIDLGPAFANTSANLNITVNKLSHLRTLTSFFDEDLPEPATLHPQIQRDTTRFYIRTPVNVHIGDRQWPLQTLDVSADGLAISMPADVRIPLNQRILVDFVRWQTLTKKVKLDSIPYQVKNKLQWQGEQRLGLQRLKQNCPQSLNDFFDWVIAKNQPNLRQNHDDVINSAESRLYSHSLLPTLVSLPLFLGIDTEGRRYIELIGATQANQAEENSSFWQAFPSILPRLGDRLKTDIPEDNDCVQTTLYGYQSRKGDWTLMLEQDFLHSRNKTLFIQRGLAAETFRVFRCTLTPLKGNEAFAEKDLIEQLQQWRQQRAHRVKFIRQQMGQLFCLAELTDITSVVTAFHQG